MPRYTILPIDQSFSSAEITALYPEAVLHIVGKLDCREADVLRDDSYSFSVRLSEHGLWSIFQRDTDVGADAMTNFG